MALSGEEIWRFQVGAGGLCVRSAAAMYIHIIVAWLHLRAYFYDQEGNRCTTFPLWICLFQLLPAAATTSHNVKQCARLSVLSGNEEYVQPKCGVYPPVYRQTRGTPEYLQSSSEPGHTRTHRTLALLETKRDGCAVWGILLVLLPVVFDLMISSDAENTSYHVCLLHIYFTIQK